MSYRIGPTDKKYHLLSEDEENRFSMSAFIMMVGIIHNI